MNVFSSIIFADSYENQISNLTENRTPASIPFCGRFRLIDFILSSLVNAGVSNVAIIPKKNFASLSDHLGDGKYWDLDHRNSGLKILSPFFRAENNTEVFQARGKLDALRSVTPYITGTKEEYVVISDGNLVANIDFKAVFDYHLSSGADITALYSAFETKNSKALLFDVGEDQRIKNIFYDAKDGEKDFASLGVYVMKKELLLKIIETAEAHDYYSFEKYALINNVESLKIMGYKHCGYARVINSVCEYFDASMQMLDIHKRDEIFSSERPIMTRVKDSVPVLYQYNAKISNSLIADGCKIDGQVKNSIIFRNVTVEAGAVIENSIVMQNSVISKDSSLNYVILDKGVFVSPQKHLCADKSYPFVLTKGSEI